MKKEVFFYLLFGKTTYFCIRNDKEMPIYAVDDENGDNTIHYSLFTIHCLCPRPAIDL